MYDVLTQNIAYAWLILGALFITFEAFGAQGIGFLFAGFAAWTIGGLQAFGVFNHLGLFQSLVWFLALSSGWALVLHKPLTKMKNKQQPYKNIIGETATVVENLSKIKAGKIKWSGTYMAATLDKSSHVENINEGSQVRIIKITGSTAIVKPL